MWRDLPSMLAEINALADRLPGLRYQTYAAQPTDEEIASLRVGTAEERIAVVIRLNDKYRDGWSPSAWIAGVAQLVHVRALPDGAPAANLPMVADVVRMMGHGLTQGQAIYALGGVN